MNLLKKIFRPKERPLTSIEDFWTWFQQNEKSFFKILRSRKNIERGFFSKLSAQLENLKEGIYFLAGMYNDQTAELIFSAEGKIKNIAFIEQLVSSGPVIEGWKFTPLKPALDISDVNIELEGYRFSKEQISFYPNENPGYPDEIDVTVVHPDFSENNKRIITNGTFIFLENYLGELDLVSSIDNLTVAGREHAQKELIPVEKLKDYLHWRQREFVEKYEGVRHNTKNDQYAVMEGEDTNGRRVIVVANSDLFLWERKPSHPWVVIVQIAYNGRADGMPDEMTQEVLNGVETEIKNELPDHKGNLNIGRLTSNGMRNIYFVCKDFRAPSKVLDKIQADQNGRLNLNYHIFKDKYWQCLEHLNPEPHHP